VPSTARPQFAHRLRDIQLARARLAALALGELRMALPAEAARVCELDRVTLVLLRGHQLDPDEAQAAARGRPLLAADAAPAFVLAPLVHPDRAIGLLRGDAGDRRALDELDRDLLWTFASATAPLLHVATLAAIARAPGGADPGEHQRRGPRRPR
jgi:hypothetical protein